MENIEIKLHVQLTEKEYLKFQTDHISALASKKWWIYIAIVMTILLFVNIHGYLENGFAGVSLTSFLPFLVFGVIIIFFTFSYKAKVKSSFKSDTTLQHPMDIIINNEGVVINAYRANTNPLWEEIYRYSITKNTIYIYTAENKSVIIPKRVFENENDLNTVVELLKNKVDLSKYKKQSNKIKYRSWLVPFALVGFILIYVFFGNSDGNQKLNEAWTYEKNGDYKNAIKLYSELILSNPDDMSYYLSRANCEISLGLLNESINDCEIAIKQNPANGRAYYYLAYALYDKGEYDKACKAINKSIEIGYTKQDDGLCEPPEN
jgi:energy-coupling factor transporter transmembrane protein EcfT